MGDQPASSSEIDIPSMLSRIEACSSESELEVLRLEWLGRQGVITQQLKCLGQMSAEARATQGAALNQAKSTLLSHIQMRRDVLGSEAMHAQLMLEGCDVTLPGRVRAEVGQIHPVMRTQSCLERQFQQLGFEVLSGECSQEVETEYYNFSALNIPESHPARAMHDTFYLKNGQLLRTHTSPVQIRILQENPQLPLRIVTPGKVFRCDSDQTHTPMFHQMEGLVVDKTCHFGHLKSLIETVLEGFFEQAVVLRFRPSYFPFTEPSAEVDIRWPLSGGADSTWLEVLGCGMVHPHVLAECRVDANQYRGYAFGFGLDRLTMLKYGAEDLRSFFSGDLGFLEQFK